MSSESHIKEFLKKRIDDISNLIHEVASGNFDHKLEFSGHGDELDGLIGGINMLGEELKASTVSKDYMESIYRGVVDILIILNRDLTIERVNEAVLNYLGYTAPDLENHHFSKLLKRDDLSYVLEITEKLKEQHSCHNVELNLVRRDGSTLPSSASLSVLYDNQKNKLGILVIAKDISLLKESERQMKVAKEKAEAANEAKSSFLANMSHEIRTPLNGILGFIELLMDTPTNELQRQYLELIKISGESLSKLLNDILDLNKVEQGKLNLENIEFALEQTLLSNLNPYSHLAREKGIDFNIKFDPSLPQYVIGDPSRINQITRNLVGNALKFTNEGFIKTEFTALQQSESKVMLVGKVIDTGIGISADKHQTIFESFTQADNSTTRKYGGTGLGLTITRHLINLMGGEIKLESPPVSLGLKSGSVFTFQIPLSIAKPSKKEKEFKNNRQVKFPYAYEILVVDDNEINLILAKRILESMGAKVTEAGNGEEAVNLAMTKKFDMILMDIQMPVMDGYLAAQKLRALDYLGPILALSANVYQDDIERCYLSGMNSHIRKPFTKHEIYDAVKKYI